jgi:hypothetical protein
VQCPTYAASSIAAMRTAAMSGCFELDHVALVDRSSSTTTPRLYVQDSAGGDYSAIMAKCSSTGNHACSAMSLATALTLADNESVTVHGYYSHGKTSGFEEFLVESMSDDGSMLSPPAPVSLGVADIARSARVTAKWFQRATVSLAAADTLVMYDFSPAEFKLQGPCPAWEGFGMIPSSAGAAAPAACNGSANPPGIASPDPKEILVGREFFHGFPYCTDCACAATHQQTLLTAANKISGTLGGILIFEITTGTTSTYQIFEPTSKTDFPVQ